MTATGVAARVPITHTLCIDGESAMNSQKPQTRGEALALINGESLETYRENAELRNRIWDEALQYEGKDPSEWPKITFNWDLSADGQRFSLDGTSKKDFEKNYPDGFLLGFVSLTKLDQILCHYSRRDEGELWALGRSHSLACLIVYLSEGRKISPPLVQPLESGEVIFNGGHHRYAIAKAIELDTIPIYIQSEYKDEIDSILEVQWANA